ncbi:MAG TPA: PilN domain-containing protein [Steroidobacteraceae bacterium]|nr:PilN domain-containing protein [Steroidobacteraceae bacterium]
MPRINLLPWRQQERAKRQKEFGLAAVGAVIAAASVTLFTAWGYNWAIERQHERNELLKTEIAELDKQITEILGLEAQKQRLVARMDIITRLQRSRPEVVHVFDQLARTLPDGVYLTSVKQNDKRLELKGIAQSSTRVSTFMRNIEASPWLTNPELQVVETMKTGGTGSEFTLFATQKSVEPAEDERRPARKAARPAGASGT